MVVGAVGDRAGGLVQGTGNAVESAAASAQLSWRIPAKGVTPSMAQFLEIKTANPDSILWYRMGDFYELFFEDAVVASAGARHRADQARQASRRGYSDVRRAGASGRRIPAAVDPAGLPRRGLRAAGGSGRGRKRGSKAVVRRDVVRLVTPGTLTEDSLLDAKARNYLTALFRAPGRAGPSSDRQPFALASLDISTGEFEVGEIAARDLAGELVRLAPGEVIAGDSGGGRRSCAPDQSRGRGHDAGAQTRSSTALSGERLLKEQLGVAELGGFGTFSRAELAAVGALLKYVALTQIGAKPVMRPPRRAERLVIS